jgi:Flp pilus assembly pilin Flp
MLRLYVAAQQWLEGLKEQSEAEEGVTVPEYMLVLGVISIALIVVFNASGVGTKIGLMSTHLASLIGLGA